LGTNILNTVNFFIVALTTFLLSACSGSVKPVVHTDSPGVTSVGQQVTLDASKTVYDRDSTYTWTIDSAPYDSEATIDSLHARTTTFTPDQPGCYEITITVANDDWDDFETMMLTLYSVGRSAEVLMKRRTSSPWSIQAWLKAGRTVALQ
jgi:hypothetical protein